MRKEVIFAIIAGIIFGVVLGLGVWRANSALKPMTASSETTQESVTPTPRSEFSLVISDPEPFDALTESPHTLLGLTSPNTWVAIISPEDRIITQSNNEGVIQKDVNLIGGINDITLVSLHDDSDALSITHVVSYSSQLFESDVSPENEEDSDSTEQSEDQQLEDTSPTPTGDPIRERVQAKIDEARTNPKSFIGTVTDKTESSLQIKNIEGEIQQVSIATETSIVDIRNDESTDATFDDIAIGDFVVAMGAVVESSVLDALRVLVTDEYTKTSETARIGQVIESEDFDFILRTSKGNFEVVFDDSVEYYGLQDGVQIEIDDTDIESGDTVIVLGELQDNTFTAYVVQITSKAEI